ncbi:MAG: SHOCT domain-containing protein [Mycobacterium sp.]
MMRRRMGRPGVVGTMARTAVVAGTATAVVGGVSSRQAGKAQAQQQQADAQQAAFESQSDIADMQAQLDAMQAQQAAPAAAPAGDDMMGKLQQLGDMKANGLLTDAEFAAAKERLLAG